jgi:hypothetical protein
LAEGGEERAIGQRLGGGLGDAEVDDLGDGRRVALRDQDVGGFEVAVDDAFLMSVLDGLADVDEEGEPLTQREIPLAAVIGNWLAAD